MTQRQQQIVNGLARRLPYKTIAHNLGVALSTVGGIAWRMQMTYGVKKSKDLPGEIEYRSWRRDAA